MEPLAEDDTWYEAARLPNLLRHYRGRSKLSQDALAIESGVNQGTISEAENGKLKPYRSTLSRLAAVLARHIPDSSEDRIFARLDAARSNKIEAYDVHPGLVMIDDRLEGRDREFLVVVLKAFNDILDALEAVFNK